MKEAYFTEANIARKAENWLSDKGLDYRRHGNFPFRPDHAALLVIDMQNYFLDEGSHAFIPSAPAIIPAVSRLISRFHDHGRPVLFTRHTADSSPTTMLEWWGDGTRRHDERSQLTSFLDSSKGIVLEKSTYDAFIGTGLKDNLRKNKVSQIVICGVMTHLCCETTARSAFNRGFFVYFPVDGTATYNDTFHLSTLVNLSHGFAVPVLVERVLEAFP